MSTGTSQSSYSNPRHSQFVRVCHSKLPIFLPLKHVVLFQKLDFTTTDGSQPSSPTVGMPIERIQAYLQDLVVEKQVRTEEIFEWIEVSS